MSYDITIHTEIRHDVTQEVWAWHGLTWNLAPMLQEGGVSLRTFDGKKGYQVANKLQNLHNLMLTNPERFKKHEPDNGWGDYKGCLEFVRAFAEAAEKYREGTVLVS